MIEILNTTNLLSKSQAEILRHEAMQAEKHGKLTNKQLHIINEYGWFKMLVPQTYGGKQLSLPEILKIEETLSYLDGSLGWVVTLCAGAGWFGGFVEGGVGARFFGQNNICVAGSGAATGTAEKQGEEYILNGKWMYASGAPQATAFTANCVVTEKGKPLTDENGKPVILSFILSKDEVKQHDEWNSFGMIATASNSFEVKDLRVPLSRAFDLKDQPVVDAALYHYPFMQLAESTLSVNIVGMTIHFMELCEQYLAAKKDSDDKSNIGDKFSALSHKLETARQKLFYAVDMSWQVCQANKDISLSLLYKVSAASAAAVNTSRECINTLYPFCGLKAANKNSEINRVWRDIQTAGQHSLLAGFNV